MLGWQTRICGAEHKRFALAGSEKKPLVPKVFVSVCHFLTFFFCASSFDFSLVMRAALSKSNINIVAVNDPFIPTNYMKYMLQYGTFL